MSSGLKKDWKDVFDDIYDIYWVQDRTLEETMQLMKTMYNFSRTKKQWVNQMDEWKLKKNTSTIEMQSIVRIQQKRKAEDGKDTDFTVRGRHVDQEKIERWQKRQKCDVPQSEVATTPSDISYNTPSEVAPSPFEVAHTPRIDPLAEDGLEFSFVGPAEAPGAEVFAMSDLVIDEDNRQIPTQNFHVPISEPMDIDSVPPPGPADSLMDRDAGYDSDGNSSVTEISREEMYDSDSDSSDSSVATIKADEYGTAVEDFWRISLGKPMASNEKNKALRAAARTGNAQLVEDLLRSGADLTSLSKSGMTAFHAAAFFGHVDVLWLLVRKGAYIEDKVRGTISIIIFKPSGARKLVPIENPTPLQLTAARGHFEATKSLLQWGANPGQDTEDSSLSWAIQSGSTSTFKLIDKHTTVLPTNYALIVAVEFGRLEIAGCLLDKGADPYTVRNTDGYSALGVAILEGHSSIVELLLDRGADPHAGACGYYTPLTLAAENGYRDIVEILLDRGVDPNQVGKGVDGALHAAAWAGHRDIVRLLLDRGADVDKSDQDGWTALMSAAGNGFEEIVELLLQKGANPNLTDDEKLTALDRAREDGFQETVELLREYGGESGPDDDSEEDDGDDTDEDEEEYGEEDEREGEGGTNGD